MSTVAIDSPSKLSALKVEESDRKARCHAHLDSSMAKVLMTGPAARHKIRVGKICSGDQIWLCDVGVSLLESENILLAEPSGS